MKHPFAPHLRALTEGPDIPLDKPIVLIGRHQECDIQIPSRKISRRHCCLAQVGDHLVVRDLGSTNGVRINGIKVVEGNLQPGDELMIGNVNYQLRWGADDDEHTLAASVKHGIMAKRPARGDDSGELPIALADVSQMQHIPQGMPLAPPAHNKANENGEAPSKPMMLPDDIGLVPLDPP